MGCKNTKICRESEAVIERSKEKSQSHYLLTTDVTYVKQMRRNTLNSGTSQSSMRRSLSKRNLVFPMNRPNMPSYNSQYKRALQDTSIIQTYLNLYYQ